MMVYRAHRKTIGPTPFIHLSFTHSFITPITKPPALLSTSSTIQLKPPEALLTKRTTSLCEPWPRPDCVKLYGHRNESNDTPELIANTSAVRPPPPPLPLRSNLGRKEFLSAELQSPNDLRVRVGGAQDRGKQSSGGSRILSRLQVSFVRWFSPPWINIALIKIVFPSFS